MLRIQRSVNDAAVLRVSGQIGVNDLTELQEIISRECNEGLVLDLSQLTFMDLMGLRMILFAKELCEWHRCDFLLVPGPVSVQRVFELTNLLDVMPFESEIPRSARSMPASRGGR